MHDLLRTLTLSLAVGVPAAVAHANSNMLYTGVNLAGAEFGGHTALPGEDGTHYIYPGTDSVDYFLEKGMNTFRLPFKWERVQRELGGDFHAPDFDQLHNLVEYMTANGAYVKLDPHNYAQYHGEFIGREDSSVTNEHFADFWSRLAETYKDNDRVIFGLMNEPHTVHADEWAVTANTAIQAIRDTGAENLILVPGTAYSGAHSWNSAWYPGPPNGEAMLDIVDPGNNFAFDVHQYLDGDSSGTSSEIVSAEIGAQRLNVFTEWAREHGVRGFLGEFAVANEMIGDDPEQIGDEALHNLFTHMEENSDVWMGWTWWAAGPWWNNYIFSIQPDNLGGPNQQDKAAMAVLEQWVVPEPGSAAIFLGGTVLVSLIRRRRRD